MNYKNLTDFLLCENVQVKQAVILTNCLPYFGMPEDSFDVIFDSINLLTDAVLNLDGDQLKKINGIMNGKAHVTTTKDILQSLGQYLQEEFYNEKFLKYMTHAFKRKECLPIIDTPNATQDESEATVVMDSSYLDEFTSGITLNLNQELQPHIKRMNKPNLVFKSKSPTQKAE